MGILLYEIVERAFCFVKTEINQIPNLLKPANYDLCGTIPYPLHIQNVPQV